MLFCEVKYNLFTEWLQGKVRVNITETSLNNITLEQKRRIDLGNLSEEGTATKSLTFLAFSRNKGNKLRLSCAKLSADKSSYPLAMTAY